MDDYLLRDSRQNSGAMFDNMSIPSEGSRNDVLDLSYVNLSDEEDNEKDRFEML